MLVFIFMNFALSMSSTLFGAILDMVASQMQISVAQAGLLSTFYAYGAGDRGPSGAPYGGPYQLAS